MMTIKNQNRNGRPKKSSAEKKGYKISLKMATEEYYSLKSKARLAGITLSEYVRSVIKKSEVKQRLSPEYAGYIRKLSGIGNNLNQIAKRANIEGYTNARTEYLYLADKIDTVINLIEDDSKNS